MRRNISLRRRLILMLLPAMVILVIAFNIGGSMLIHEYVENAHDQILSGSALAIGEETDLLDDELRVDIPIVAFAMLRVHALDNIYYNVYYDGAVVTGYENLPLPDKASLQLGEVVHRDGVYRGQPVRIAALTKRLYGGSGPAIVQVAQTTRSSKLTERRLLIPFILVQAALIAVTGTIIWFGIRRGLAPIAALRREIENRAGFGAASFQPLSTTSMPRELLPLVASFNTLLQRLQTSFENNRRFTTNASHQIRTPLAVIRTHVCLLRRISCENEAKDVIEDIESGVLRLERLVTQLITIARAEENSIASDGVDTVDLIDVAAQSMADRVGMAVQKNLTLDFDNRSERETIPVRGTEILIQQLIGNLLENAILYTPDGGQVVMRIYDSGSHARLEIEDTGPGIRPEYRETVFERFYRMPSSSNQVGSGLGLAIVHTICTLIGADIVLTDRINRAGLRVIVSFPPSRRYDPDSTRHFHRHTPAYPQPFWDLELRRRVN